MSKSGQYRPGLNKTTATYVSMRDGKAAKFMEKRR
jgi:hypothetical protein